MRVRGGVGEAGRRVAVGGRGGFGGRAEGAYVLGTRQKMIVTRSLVARGSALAILANIMPFALISWGEQHIDSGTASVLNAMVPIFTAVVAAIALDEEHFTPARLGGLLLGFVGVAVLTGTESLDVTDAAVAGQLAVVGAALCYGLGAVYMRSLLREQDAVSLTMLQLMLSVLIAGALLIVVSGAPSYSLSLEAWASLIALGTLGTGVGYVMFVWLIENIGSVRASLVTYIVPVLALFLGWLILDESIGVNTIAGFLLIIAGVATVMRGQTPSNQRQREPVAPAAVGE